jgi:hypothetical protein
VYDIFRRRGLVHRKSVFVCLFLVVISGTSIDFFILLVLMSMVRYSVLERSKVLFINSFAFRLIIFCFNNVNKSLCTGKDNINLLESRMIKYVSNYKRKCFLVKKNFGYNKRQSLRDQIQHL